MKQICLKYWLLCICLVVLCPPAEATETKIYTTADGLAHNNVQGLCLDESGMLWICSWYGLERFDGYRFVCFRPDNFSGANSRFKRAWWLKERNLMVVRTLEEEYLAFSLTDYTFQPCDKGLTKEAVPFVRSLTDRLGNRWEKLDLGIAFTLSPPTFYRRITHPDYPYPRTFFEDSAGRVWIAWGDASGASEGEVILYDGQGEQLQTVFAGCSVYSIFEDSSHQIWLGTRKDGLVVLRPDGAGGYHTYRYQRDRGKESLPHNSIFYLTEDRSGRIWIATLGGGLCVVEADYDVADLRFHRPENFPRREFPRVRSLLMDGDDFFIGTDKGLLKSRTDCATDQMEFVNLSQEQEASGSATEMIHLSQRRNREILFSSFGSGIYRYDPEQGLFTPYAADETADSQAVYSMLENRDGDLWVVSQTALMLYREDGSCLNPIREPMIFLETRPLCDRQGDCWFATTEGALRVGAIPPPPQACQQTKPRFLEVVFRHGEERTVRKLSACDTALVVRPQERNLSLLVSSLRYGEMEQVRYAWRLVGKTTGAWVETEPNQALHITELEAGDWWLEVRSTDGMGRWLERSSKLLLRVAYRWHERWTTRAIAFLLLLFIVGWVVWLLLRLKKLQAMYHSLFNSQLLVSMQTAMIDIKPEESLTEADKLFIDSLNRLIGERFADEHFSIDTIASAMNMSRSVFYRRLKAVVGQTPVEYLKEFRLQQATEKLKKEQEKAVASIAYECGFSSPQYFSNVFRKRYHMTPNEWRRKNLNK